MNFSTISNSQLTTTATTSTVSRRKITQQAVQPSVDTVPTHPEALRRRTEALKRKEQLQQNRLKQTSTNQSWWEIDVPENVQIAYTVEDLKNVMECGIRNNQLVVVELFAPWCVVCKYSNQSFHQLAQGRPHVLFVKIAVVFEWTVFWVSVVHCLQSIRQLQGLLFGSRWLQSQRQYQQLVVIAISRVQLQPSCWYNKSTLQKFSVAGNQNRDYCMEELEVKNVPYFVLYYNGFILSRLKTTKNNLKGLRREIDNHDPQSKQVPLWLKTSDEIFM
eukprot:TRINITY_DN4469_c0_g1_i6.p1 TRINITY_DN4469_c0_g1~~TRINITY_DN4469_c0_g1_i6.p1  ORF type:complete len:275 (-),score=22.92 TRINITY_DN4469_c0_g1_i6:453-1277(-)